MDTKAFIEKFPKKVWFGTYEVAVHFVPSTHEKLNEDGACDGFTDLDSAVAVYVCESLSLVKLLEIVKHEFTHVVNWVGGIDDGAEEEEVCRKHGEIWSQFSINNPRFERWWLSACIAVRKAQAGTPERKKRS